MSTISPAKTILSGASCYVAVEALQLLVAKPDLPLKVKAVAIAIILGSGLLTRHTIRSSKEGNEKLDAVIDIGTTLATVTLTANIVADLIEKFRKA